MGFNNIEFEPDGNVPPDFLCDGNVAVEVRRLNKHSFDGAKPQGLETSAIPIWKNLKQYLESIGPPRFSQSWYVFHRFSRPLPKWNHLKLEMDKLFMPYLAGPVSKGFDKEVLPGFHLQVFCSPTLKSDMFRLAGQADDEAGGWLLEDLDKNLEHCIREKEQKTKLYRSKYKEWWLLLEDQITYGLDDFDREIFNDTTRVTNDFARVILFDPRDPSRIYDYR